MDEQLIDPAAGPQGEPIIPAMGNDGLAAPDAKVAGPSGPAAPAFDPSPFKISYKGREIVPRDINHVRGLMQKGYGFDQEIEGFKQKQREFEERSSKLGRVQELYDGLQNDPMLARKIFDLYEQHSKGGQPIVPDGEEVPPYVQSILEKNRLLEERLLEHESRWKQFDTKNADAEIEKELESLKGHPAFKDQDWETTDDSGMTLGKRIMKYALDRNISSLEDAAKSMMYDSVAQDMKARGLAAAKDKRIMDKRQGIVDGGSGLPPAPAGPGYSPNAGWSERQAAAVRDLTMKG